MVTARGDDVTTLLVRWRAGSPEAEELLMAKVQRELRKLAASYLRRERPGHTLQPTAVVNEAYMRLVPQRNVHWENRAHFFGIAAQMMRRILVDHARRRRAAKRGDAEPLSLSGIADPRAGPAIDVLALHEALNELARLDARQERIVELRFFGGLSIDEIAAVVEVSPATVKRDLATARLWLKQRMRGA